MPHGVRYVKSSVKTASAQISAYGGKVWDWSLLSDGASVGYARLINGTPITLDYDSGGAATPTIGETITGAGGRVGTLVSYTTASGTWGGGDAAGVMTLIICSGGVASLFTNNEALAGSTSGADMATTDGTGDAGTGGTEIESLKVSATASDVTMRDYSQGRSFGVLYLYVEDCTVSVGYTDNT